MRPFFSIIIPLYNKQDYIAATINDITKQTFTDYEIIVVDDGSTDNSFSIVNSINNSKLRIFSKPNSGVSSTRNEGAKLANGKWLLFFDADDVLYGNALETFYNLIKENTEHSVVISSYDTSYKKFKPFNRDHICKDYFYENISYYASGGFLVAWTGCVCIKKTAFEEIGGFNENYTNGEDLDLWYRLISKYTAIKTDIVTAEYILYAMNNSNSNTNKKFAPIAILHERNYYKTFYQKILVGAKVFHTAINRGIFRSQKKNLCLLIKYFDWVLIYLYYFVKVRIKISCKVF